MTSKAEGRESNHSDPMRRVLPGYRGPNNGPCRAFFMPADSAATISQKKGPLRRTIPSYDSDPYRAIEHLATCSPVPTPPSLGGTQRRRNEVGLAVTLVLYTHVTESAAALKVQWCSTPRSRSIRTRSRVITPERYRRGAEVSTATGGNRVEKHPGRPKLSRGICTHGRRHVLDGRRRGRDLKRLIRNGHDPDSDRVAASN